MLIDSLPRGGKERRLIELIKGLTGRNIVCELVVLSNRLEYEEVHDLGIKIHILKRKFKKDPSVVAKLFKICKRLQPDILQTWESMPAVYAVPVSIILRIPLINSMIAEAPDHIKRFSPKWLRCKLTFPFSKVIVANSQAGLLAYSAPPRKSRYIHNGFDMGRITSLIPPEEIRKKFQFSHKYVVGMVASFSHLKDYRSYLEAAKLILEKRDNVCFICIGGGNGLRAHQESLEKEYRNDILFLGSQKNVESIANTFTIGVLSTFTEGISNAIMEFMALSKPVVATDGGGTKELVVHGKTGFLVPPRSPRELASKIDELLTNELMATTMGVEGKQRILNHFNLNKMTENFIALYKECSAKN